MKGGVKMDRLVERKVFAFVILMFLVVGVSSCASIPSKDTFKALALSKVAAEEIVRTAKDLNSAGELSDENLLKVKEAYEVAKLANHTLINSMIMAIDLGRDPITDKAYNNALQRYREATQNLWDLGFSLGLIE